MKPSECEGCLSYSSKGRCFGFIHGDETISVEDVYICPCAECLVKPMCTVMCSSFRNERLRKKDMI